MKTTGKYKDMGLGYKIDNTQQFIFTLHSHIYATHPYLPTVLE